MLPIEGCEPIRLVVRLFADLEFLLIGLDDLLYEYGEGGEAAIYDSGDGGGDYRECWDGLCAAVQFEVGYLSGGCSWF